MLRADEYVKANGCNKVPDGRKEYMMGFTKVNRISGGGNSI